MALELAKTTTEWENIQMTMVGVFSKNREEWVTLDICNCMYGFTMVPLYDVFGPSNIEYCLDHTGMQVCFCSEQAC